MSKKSKAADSTTRENVLRIRLTEAEREELDKAAQDKGGLDTSTWARMELLLLARGKK